MASNSTSLENMYARLALDEEESGEVIEGISEKIQPPPQFVLIGSFLTEKNINFQAMKNVLASIWRPREGMEIHDLGDRRYSFIFYHALDLQKVIDGGPWTCEQSLLLYRRLENNEDARLITLNRMEIWVQIYDLPTGMLSSKIMESIGNYVGVFVKADPQNLNGGWKMYYRIRVVMDTDKPLKRRMKVKREGGEWTWINFKYERLSTFCFVCGLMGHSDRDCGIVYANPDKNIERAYGTWLRALGRSGKNQNIGARWLRNGGEGEQNWRGNSGGTQTRDAANQEAVMGERFMEIDGQITEIIGETGAIRFNQNNHGGGSQMCNTKHGDMIAENPQTLEKETIITDPKRKRGMRNLMRQQM